MMSCKECKSDGVQCVGTHTYMIGELVIKHVQDNPECFLTTFLVHDRIYFAAELEKRCQKSNEHPYRDFNYWYHRYDRELLCLVDKHGEVTEDWRYEDAMTYEDLWNKVFTTKIGRSFKSMVDANKAIYDRLD